MRGLQILSTIFWLIFLPAALMASSKIDTIYFQNGDRVTGEVKSLENDLLRLSTDDAGTFKIEWTKVDSVYIRNRMRILLLNGEILYGMLLPSGVEKSCMIWGSDGDPKLVALKNIVELSPIKDRFFNRLSGSVSSGFSYTKASDVLQMNLNGSLKYLANKNLIETSYSGSVTRDPLGTSQRQNGGFTFHRMLPKKWFLSAELLAESNSELQLDLRTSFGIGAGNSIIRTNRHHFYAAAGILTNRELSQEIAQNNVEGLVAVNYSVFVYDDPEISFDISSNIIPSINDPGRVRSETESNLKWEIFSDFYLKWTFYYSFDSKPLSSTAEKKDWGITLLGLEYKL